MGEWLAAGWAEWSSYRPSDFLMFAPRTYWRLFELHNQSLGAAALLIWAAGLAALWSWCRPEAPHRWPANGRSSFWMACLALGWAAVAWFFLHQRYAPVFWAMQWAAWAFVAQALLLLAVAVAGFSSSGGVAPTSAARKGGMLLLGWAVLLQPLLALLSGRPWMQAEIIGLAPDPTVFATLGLLLCVATPVGASRALYAALWVMPLAWCAVSAATLWTMGSAQAAVPALVGLAAVACRKQWRRTPRPAAQPEPGR